MKNRGMIIMVIIALTIIAVLLLSFMIYVISGKHINRFAKISDEKIVDEIYDNKFDNITINSDAADVEIVSSEDEEFHLVIYGKKDLVHTSNTEDTLDIDIKLSKCFGICFNVTMSKVILYVPTRYDGKMEVSNKYGDIQIGNFEAADVTLDASCGDIKVHSLKKADINNSYGNIEVENVEDATVNASCGDIDIGTIESGKIKNSLGDITIGQVNYMIDIDEDCGNVKIDYINLHEDSQISNALGDIRIGQTNEIYIDANTSLGDVKIQNNYHQSDYTLKIRNNAGDITVRN